MGVASCLSINFRSKIVLAKVFHLGREDCPLFGIERLSVPQKLKCNKLQ